MLAGFDVDAGVYPGGVTGKLEFLCQTLLAGRGFRVFLLCRGLLCRDSFAHRLRGRGIRPTRQDKQES
jgi:hypothetical protein